MKEEHLTGALQENVLTLLCFDDAFCPIVRNTVSASMFESRAFQDIASHAIDYYDRFGEAIKEHIADELEPILEGSDKRKGASYKRILDNLFIAKEEMNRDYVISKLNMFVRQQCLKSSIVRAVESLDDGNVDQAEIEISKGLSAQMNVFEAGTFFADPKQSLKFMDQVNEGIITGIEEFDKRDVCPRRKEMYMIVAPAKKGKSWGLIHIGKWALLQRLRVLHVTLEMSEERTSMRYIQSFFSVSKRDPLMRAPSFVFDSDGRLSDIAMQEIERPTLAQPNIRAMLTNKLQREFRRRPPLIIKQFPTKGLTIQMLNAYLDSLERFHKFVPDVIILDYPKLMKMDDKNLRTELGVITEQLRGIGIERNAAMVVAAQGNRDSATAKTVTDTMIGEDYSQIATADNVITYSQTPQEKKLGLARLYVSNGRNDEDKFSVLISQNYNTGQFCLDSAYMIQEYEDLIETKGSGKRRRQPDEDD